jgi:putative flippase GtrA
MKSLFHTHFFVFAKFGLVGATTAAVYFLVMWGADSILNVNNIEVISFARMFPVVIDFIGTYSNHYLSNSILNFNLKYIAVVSAAYTVSTTFHFVANRHFTFGAVEDKHQDQIFRYLVMWCINYVITILVVSVCVERFLFSPYLGVCVSVVFTMFIGYFLGRYWVFKV